MGRRFRNTAHARDRPQCRTIVAPVIVSIYMRYWHKAGERMESFRPEMFCQPDSDNVITGSVPLGIPFER
jgi:hypothetical protein